MLFCGGLLGTLSGRAMSVLRYIVNHIYSLWARSFLRLKHPGREIDQQVKQRVTHRVQTQVKKQVKKQLDARVRPKSSPLIARLKRLLLFEHQSRLGAQFDPLGEKDLGNNSEQHQGSYHHVRNHIRLNKARSSRSHRRNRDHKSRFSGSRSRQAVSSLTGKNGDSGQWSFLSPFTENRQAWLITLLSILILATCFGQRFYRQPGLDIRSVAPKDFYAPAAAVVEDKKATELRRDDVRNGATQVLKIDLEQTAEAEDSLKTLLEQGQELRSQAGRPNFINLNTLSKSAQDYLFQSSEAQWRKIWRLAKTSTLSPAQVETIRERKTVPLPEDDSDDSSVELGSDGNSDENNGDESLRDSLLSKVLTDQVRSLTIEQTSVLRELLAYRDLSGAQGLSLLQTRVDTRRKQYLKAYEDFVEAASTKDQPLYNSRLFELSEEEWAALERNAKQIFNEMMLQGISPGVPEDVMRRAIEARVSVEPSKAVRDLTADVLAASVVPNLVVDQVRSRQQAEQAVRQIDPVEYSLDKGDQIVGANQMISSSEFALLDHFGLTNRYFNWIGLSGFAVLVGFAVAFYLWVDQRQATLLNQRDHYLIMLLCLVVSMLAALKVPTIGLPAVGLLVGSFYGAARGITVIGLLTLVLPIGTSVSYLPLLAGCAAAMLGAWIAPQLRSREEFALLGGFVGLTQASVYLVLTLIRFTAGVPLWKAVFVGSATYGLYGIAWSVVALGVSPYLEHFFDVVTPIRLAELANPNRPLLKRLAAEAPGTFQHTMFVANLAEAAARALGLNVELVRAGTLYHDIGKMHAPQGFIENQMGGPNMHDALDDPWKSASIIKKHVTQGLVMARQYRLPLAIQAFIPEHQGDMKISYFYQQAKAKQEENPSLVVNPADFSYDGPIPQSPETGITMLADSCEAALRSLRPEASMDEAYAMVNKILRARWRSRQLMDSGLSREEMDTIASVFIQVWQQHNHKRIEYPKDVLVEQAR